MQILTAQTQDSTMSCKNDKDCFHDCWYLMRRDIIMSDTHPDHPVWEISNRMPGFNLLSEYSISKLGNGMSWN
jgi:hypothetical protein